MLRTARLTLVMALALAVPAAAQSAQVKKYVNAAIALYENLEYEKALKQLTKAKAKATTPDDEAKIALLEGIVLADMGKEEKALTAFTTAFGIDVEAKLPVEVSPKVLAAADKARANVRKRLAPQLEAQKEEEAKRVAEEKRRAEEEAKRLAEQRQREEEERARTRPPPAVARQGEGPSLRTLAWIPGGIGLVGLGVGTAFFLDANAKYNALANYSASSGVGPPDPAQALTLRDGGKSSQLLGWVFTGVGAAGVIAAVTMFAIGGPKAPAVTLVPTREGALVVVSLDALLEVGR